MVDIVDTATRSRMMSGIKGKDTKPEMVIRKMLHSAGFRYRLHDKRLPGKPDLVLPRYRTVLFVHGCFWHGHSNCALFRLPGTRREFWSDKIGGNIDRDAKHILALQESGWNVAVVWECSLKGASKLDPIALTRKLTAFIRDGRGVQQFRSDRPGRS